MSTRTTSLERAGRSIVDRVAATTRQGSLGEGSRLSDYARRSAAFAAFAAKSKKMYADSITDDDLALFVRAQLHLEGAITRALDNALRSGVFDWDSPDAPEFLVRAKLAFGLNILDQAGYNFAKKVARIRNEFAHRLDRQLSEADATVLHDQVNAECKEFVSLSRSVASDAWLAKPVWNLRIISMMWYQTMIIETPRDLIEFVMAGYRVGEEAKARSDAARRAQI
jgi:hypothetical protein